MDIKENGHSELLFQASGSLKLLKIWMERVARQTMKTWDDDLDKELCSLKQVVIKADDNLVQLNLLHITSSAMHDFHYKLQELIEEINTKEMHIIQEVCKTIQNQLDYIVNYLDKRRNMVYENQ